MRGGSLSPTEKKYTKVSPLFPIWKGKHGLFQLISCVSRICGEVPIPLLLRLPHTSDWGVGEGDECPRSFLSSLFLLQTVTDERTEEEEKVPGEKREKEGGGGDPIALSQSCCRPISTEEEEEENETRSICLPSLLFLPPLLPFRVLRWEFYSGADAAAGCLLTQRGCAEESRRREYL